MLELGDILYYITSICNILGLDIAEIMMNNNAKLMARYSAGYSVNASLNRIEEQAQQNLDKLASRRERGVIDGNGDNR